MGVVLLLTAASVRAAAQGCVSSSARCLDTVAVAARAGDGRPPDVGRTTVVRQADAAREAGAGTMAGLLQQLPLVQLRAARGETALALRGARREQLLVTLDGLPLNDPATGVADAGELPLALVHAAMLRLGADPQRAPGAIGGELALTSASRPALVLRSGAFGERQLEGVGRRVGARAVWHAAAAWQQARNDFPFVNAAGAAPARERRVNNDEARATLAAGATGAAWQVALLAAWRERGMVGPANVRAFDADRARTERLLLRARRSVGPTRLVAGSRWMTLDYRDPARPVLDRSAVAGASELEWQGRHDRVDWEVAAGVDHLAATGDIRQRRQRGAASVRWRSADAARTRWEAGARLDAITGAGVVPGGSVAVEHPLGARVALTMRAASAMRAPTLYDLYFAAPQRLAVAPLAPERVRADVAAGVRAAATLGGWRWTLATTAVGRTVRDAIVWFPGNFGWSPANVGAESLRGGELTLDGEHPRARLSLWGTRYDAQLRSGALRIPTPYVAAWAGGGQLQWRAGAHTLSATLRAMGRRPFTAGPRASAFELPAAALLDLAIARRLGRGSADRMLIVALDNATNHAWEPVRGYPAPGRALSLSIAWGASAPRHP